MGSAQSGAQAERQRALEETPRRALGVGAIVAACGLAMAALGLRSVAACTALLGLAAVVFGIHAYGRLGPEEPLRSADARRRKLSNAFVMGVVVAAAAVAILVGMLRADPANAPSAAASWDDAAGIIVAGAALIVGAGLAFSARKRLSEEETRPPKVEKRRRLGKIPPP